MNEDARGNDDPAIVFKISNLDETGNNIDDDGDGETDEPDEIFISYDAAGVVPGDGLDNDADGETDEAKEGIDEPDEFRPERPYGDDNPYNTIEELKEIELLNEVVGTDAYENDVTIYDVIKNYVTVYSRSP